MLKIQADTPPVNALQALHSAAFGREAEGQLAVALSQIEGYQDWSAYRGKTRAELVGHIVFSPVTLADCPLQLLGLGPMAVQPEHQRQGVGSQLIKKALSDLRQQDIDAVVVLGHPDYYPRFGFVPASQFGLRSAYDVPDEVFMAQELKPGALDAYRGQVRYHRVFDGI